MMKKLYFFSLAVLFVLTGCESNPYPANGHLELAKQEERRKTKKTIGLKIGRGGQKVFNFTEGVPGEILIEVQVPANDPWVFIKNRPETEGIHRMYFDPVESKIKWTPSFRAADHPTALGEGVKLYDIAKRVKFYLLDLDIFSLSDPKILINQTLLLKIQNRSEDFRILGPTEVTLTEGERFTAEFTIINKDFPNQPHTVKYNNAHRELYSAILGNLNDKVPSDTMPLQVR